MEGCQVIREMAGFQISKIPWFQVIGLLFVWLPVCHVVFPAPHPRVKRSVFFLAFYTLRDRRAANQRAACKAVTGLATFSARIVIYLMLIRIRGLAPLKISLINKYRHQIDVQNIQWNRSKSAHLQRVQVWFEITDRFCVEVSRNSIFLQDYKHIKLLGLLKREILLMLIVAISLN